MKAVHARLGVSMTILKASLHGDGASAAIISKRRGEEREVMEREGE